MKTYDFILFGGTGLQGGICARDLLDCGYRVLLVGRDKSRVGGLLKRGAGFASVDLRNEQSVFEAIKQSGAKVVINCAELIYNVEIMKACLRAQRPCTDLGGLQKVTMEQFKLHKDFVKAGIINITGCGSTPGINNVMAAYAIDQFESVDTITLGFAWNSNKKVFVVPYSMQSIFDEFTQYPVTYHDGRFLQESRLQCRGTFDFKAVGRQTVYCIVHSEVYTFAKYFAHKGLRNIHYLAGFPEHSLNVIQTLMDLGFYSNSPVQIEGVTTTPLEFTIGALKDLKVPAGYKEIENLWVQLTGVREGRVHTTEMNCIVKTVKGWEDAGSNIDTGRTISVISQMLLQGLIDKTGVYGPEAVVPQEEFFKELAKRKMWIYQDGKKIN